MNGMAKGSINRRSAWLTAVVLLLVISLAIIGFVWVKNRGDSSFEDLKNYQEEMIQLLNDREGEYDQQSIVLHDTNEWAAKKLASLFNARLRITKNGEFATLTLPEGTTILDVISDDENLEYIKSLSADWSANISDIEDGDNYERIPESPDYEVKDALYSYQTYLNYLNLDNTWSNYLGRGVTVAVIDTGIDTDHPEFEGRISEYSYNASEDKIVKDYVLGDGSYDWSLIEDTQGHGTAVAGVIGAAMDEKGTVGIAPMVNILVIKAECDETGSFKRTSDLVFGLYYAIERDVDIVNMSFGGKSNAFSDVAKLGRDSDILMIASAGNDSSSDPNYPAADENVIGIGALDDGSWELAPYSNFGENVNVVAPGTTFTTTVGGDYGIKSGTSLSAPVVAGALALMMEDAFYKYSINAQILELIYASAYDVGDLGPDYYYGYGAIDVSALISGERGRVTFDYLTDEIEETEQIFISGNPLQSIPEPDRLYSVFDGWYYDIECTEPLELYVDSFEKDLTLYAKWINEDDGIPYTYVILDDGTVEIRSYTGHRKYITVPEKIEGRVVSSIGDFAFMGENKLREIQLPNSITHIGISAFENCTNLISMQIPDSVASIDSFAFKNNTRLSSVIFSPNSKLKTVKGFAFNNCVRLTRIDLPATLESIDGSAFYGASSITKINVDSANPKFTSESGVLFDKSKTTVVAYPAGVSTPFALPDSILTVGKYAFAYSSTPSVDLNKVEVINENAFDKSRIRGVVIPDSVTLLGASVFSDCAYLSSVTIGSGVTEIPGYAFFGDSILESITIPAGVKIIGEYAFNNSGLRSVSIPQNSSLTEIGIVAFSSTFIDKIVLPKSLTNIGSAAFASCFNLSNLTFAQNGQLHTIGESAFANSVSLKSVTLPTSLVNLGDGAFSGSGLTGVMTIPSGVKYFGSGAFASCHNLTAFDVLTGNASYVDYSGVVYTKDGSTVVAYPAGNTATSYTIRTGTVTVGKSAFEGSGNLTDVTARSGLTEILGNAFYKCSNVTSYSLPETLTDIGEYAFSENTSLTYFEIPKNVITVGRYAFAMDRNLLNIDIPTDSKMSRIGFASFAHTGIYSFTVPQNVSTIAQYAFDGSNNLTSIYFAENSKLESVSAYMFIGAEKLVGIQFYPGSALTSVQAHGFEGLSQLVSVDFGDAKINNIDNYAFRFCSSLQSITLPETVENIGRFAFYMCNSLGDISIPEATEHIGSYAFCGAENCNLYFTSEQLPAFLDEKWDVGVQGYYTGVTSVSTSGDWKYATKTNGNIAIIEYLGNDSTVDLTTLNLGGKIETIGGYAFANSDITSVTLPSSLIEIQRYAFAHTDKLEKIIIPASVKHIGSYAFVSSAIKSLTMNSGIEVIERYAFAFTENLSSVKLPNTLRTLGSFAFYNSSLTSLSFSSGFTMTEIPESAFASTGISSVVIPDSITRIHSSAFRDNMKLKSVTLGGGEDLRIDSNAFYNTGIESLYIPKNLRYIGEYAFIGLENLKSYQIDADNPYYTVVDGVLYNKDKTKLVAFPAGRTGSFEVPSFVETIGFGAFENSSLSSISFAKDINLLTIGWRAFFGAENITSISLPESLISIDYYAFAGCKNLTEVKFAENNNIKGIYEGAFFGCQNLKNIVIPSSIVEISEYAFYGCMSLTEIPISEDSEIKGIFDYAFAYTGITELTVPDSVIDIGNYAFRGTLIEEVYIPDRMKEDMLIGIGAFADCNKLEKITIPFIGESLDSPDRYWFGYIFGAGSFEANAAYVPESLKVINISEGITRIPQYAFYYLENLESISVPHSVTHIGEMAFHGTVATYELTNEITLEAAYMSNFGEGLSGHITLADGLLDISYGAFAHCKNLTGVSIPDTVKYISDSAFCDTGIRSIELPESLEIIGDGAFTSCRYLTTIVIPDSVKSIGELAFVECESLSTVTLGKSLESIGDYAFARYEFELQGLYKIINRSSLKLTFGSLDNGGIALNAKVIVDADGNYTFNDQQSHTSFIETDDGFIFEYIDGQYTLKSYVGEEDTITLPRDINGSSYRMDNFRGGVNIIIPDGIKEIDEYAFFNNTSIKSVVIPDSVTKIGGWAFAQTTLEEVHIPDSVTEIGPQAFRMCTSLETANIPPHVTSISGIYESCSSLKSIAIPDTITCISDSAFNGCESLESIYIPSSVTQIDMYAFYYCISLKEVIYADDCKVTKIGNSAFGWCESLEEFVIPSSVEEIGEDAFVDCSGLTEIKLHNSIKHIGSGAFGNTSINEIHISDNHPYFTLNSGVLYTKDYTDVLYVLKDVTELTLPGGMTSISSKAFKGCATLVSVVIPDSVTQIESEAFSGCSSLENITISDNVTTIGNEAFNNCSSLKNITVPDSVNYIGYGAFWGCKALESIKLPDSITEIDSLTFANCESLKSIDLPKSLTRIGSGAFMYCKSLESIVLPDSIVRIENAFSNCELLQSINIPDGVTQIESGTFTSCYSLSNVSFGENSKLTRIGDLAFMECQSLSSFTIPKGVTDIDVQAFYGCHNLFEVVNNSSLSLTFGAEDCGHIAYYANVIKNASGNITYREQPDGSTFMETDDGFLFRVNNGKYTLISYRGSEQTITLPVSVNGSEYTIDRFTGGVNIIIPDGITEISNYAFCENTSLRSVSIPNSVTKIGDNAFEGCRSLQSIDIPDGVTEIGYGAFSNCFSIMSVVIPDSVTSIGDYAFTGCFELESITIPDSVKSMGKGIVLLTDFYDNADNWTDGALYIGNHLIKVKEDVKSFTVRSDLTSVAPDVFNNCHLLTEVTLGGNHVMVLSGITNLETLVITELPTEHSIVGYFDRYEGNDAKPFTLSKVIIKQGCQLENDFMFKSISDVTIFVENEKEECPWDDAYIGWNNNNKVVYGGDWYYVNYLDEAGEIITTHYYKSHEVVRPPYVYSYKNAGKQYSFMGWDTDGDGVADGFPASINKNYELRAIVEVVDIKYHITFVDDDGETVLYQYELGYGEKIPTPEDPTREGCIFWGWSRIPSKVTKDTVIVAKWHNHTYLSTTVAPTCTAKGYTEQVCNGCGDRKVDSYVDMIPHPYTVKTVAPTCTEKGYTEHVCTACGDRKVDSYVDMLSHSYTVKTVAPTCAEKGYDEYTCQTCGEVKKDNYLDATGLHSFNKYVYNGDGNNGVGGTMTAKCDYCTATDTRPYEKAPAVLEFENAVDAIFEVDNLEQRYEAIRNAMTIYNGLDDAQRSAVSQKHFQLVSAINDYNSKAVIVNREAERSNSIALSVISFHFSFISALWFLLRKKFIL